MRARVVAIVWITALCSSACATSPQRTPARPAPSSTLAPSRPLPKEIRWFRTSAEYRALAVLVYRDAADHLPALTQGLAPQTWGVILDADETILDNSEYQRRRTLLDSGYTEATCIPALTIVEWLGDNIQDFPRLTQAARSDSTALAEFGRRYFVLPNPMYGSWERP